MKTKFILNEKKMKTNSRNFIIGFKFVQKKTVVMLWARLMIKINFKNINIGPNYFPFLK
jgi:hypothetical protein